MGILVISTQPLPNKIDKFGPLELIILYVIVSLVYFSEHILISWCKEKYFFCTYMCKTTNYKCQLKTHTLFIYKSI